MIILIVEDDESSREALAGLLRIDGYSVHAACDGVEALTLARTLDPDLVVTDICMPCLSGVEICQRLRRFSATRPVRIFAVTALAPDTWADFEEAGFDAIFSKPLDYEALALLISRHAKAAPSL